MPGVTGGTANVAGGALGGALSGAPAGPPGMIAGAAIGAASSLGSSLIGKHSNDKALKAQQQASDKALALERERDAYNRAEAKRIEELQRQQFMANQAQQEAYRRMKLAFLKQYNPNIPDLPQQPSNQVFVPGQQSAQMTGAPQGPSIPSNLQSPAIDTPGAAPLPQLSLDQIMSWGSNFGRG